MPSDNGPVLLIESKGQGGYLIVAPTDASHHDKGAQQSWEILCGGLDTMAEVHPDDHARLLDIARSFDRSVPPVPHEPPAPGTDTGDRPGDEFDASSTDVLAAAGFERLRVSPDGTTHWRRPGKDRGGWSLTVWPDGRATPWSTAIDAPAEYVSGHRRLTAWQLHVALNHAGDHSAAARAWRADHPRPPVIDALAAKPIAANAAPARRLQLVRADTIALDRPTWAWDRRIPVGGVTLMAGREGMGKTALVCWLAAQITRGQLPGRWHGQPASVVYIGHEDDRATVLNPRLVDAGADLEHFYFIDVDGGFTVARDADTLAVDLKPLPVALVIIDPLDSHLGATVDTHKKAEVQATITRMADLAQNLRCGVLGLGHLNKAPIRDLLAKIVGSVGFTTAPRSVLAVGEYPDDPNDAVCVLAKCNMANRRDVPAIRFRVGQAFVPHPDGGIAIETAHVHIVGDVTGINADALLGLDAPARSKVDAAHEWLGHALASGPVRWSELKAAADAHGHSKWALQEARKRYGESLIIEEEKTDKGRFTQWRMGGHPVETGPDDPPIPSDQEKRPSAAGVVRSLQRPDDPPKPAPFCRFRAGSTWCVNDPCPNPNHRPQPTTESDEP
jgi:hypothetical protein